MPRLFGLILALSLCLYPSLAAAQETSVSFVNDVLPVLTRLGCNQGACHGKSSGQNGFRLSLRAYAPELDHLWLTREFQARRLNPAAPEESLLLLKPLGAVPHEGGKLLTVGSRAYETLLAWIRAGTPGPNKDDPQLKRLTLLPGDRLLKKGDRVQLTVQAEYSDGTVKDVTWLTQFASNDSNVADVAPDGLATVVRPGATALRAAFQGHVAVLVITAPHEQPVSPALYQHKNNVIDEHVFQKLAELRIEPSDLCSDEVFLRRVYLDAMGTLPTPDEVRAFLADRTPNKRAKLIDRVLERPEFIDFWALQLGDLLQNRKESDHDVRGTKGVRALHQWLRRQVAGNRPWDEMVRELLTATGDTSGNPAIGYFIVTVGEKREAHHSTVVASVAQTFLGTRIGCAQCHNHPSEKYTQDDYYHFAAFFSRLTLERKEPKMGPTKLLVSHADRNQNKNPVGVVQPRTGKFLKPQPLDRSLPEIKPDDDPRQALVDWMVQPTNEYFAGAMVNRLWAHFFGVGLVEPIDDLRASNPPSNPALWQALVREFADRKFDRKHLIRLILNSRAYQLSSVTRPSNEKDQRFYSHYYARRLPAEVMLDAVSHVTGVPEQFDGYPLGVRAIQVPDPAVPSYFLSLFGRSERITACACERNNEVTLPQLLHLLGGPKITDKIRNPEGRMAALLKAKGTPAALVDELFLLAFARLPNAAEREAIDTQLRDTPQAGVDEFFRDLLWVLINTKEFAFNH